MIPLRILAVLLLAVFFAGCDVVDDIKALKADIRALRVYLMAQPSPLGCHAPGMHEYSNTCYYRLQITDDKDKAKGRYKGKFASDVYEKDVKDCEEAKKTLRPEFKDLAYDCPKPEDNPGRDVIYTFRVEGNPVLEVGKIYDFDSVPETRFLAKR